MQIILGSCIFSYPSAIQLWLHFGEVIVICETQASSNCIRSYQRTIGNTKVTVENIEPLSPTKEASLEATARFMQLLYEIFSKYCETP